LGKFHPGTDPLAEFVPERATAQYALHPDKWESTFYSLTNKDSDKLKYYGPKKISIPPGTLVGDMAIANKFYRAKTAEEKQQYAELYRESLKPYPVDVSAYRMPELLIPQQGVAEDTMRGVIYTKPNLEHEWPEANRYPEFHKLGKDQWIKIARQGSMANKAGNRADRYHGVDHDDHLGHLLFGRRRGVCRNRKGAAGAGRRLSADPTESFGEVIILWHAGTSFTLIRALKTRSATRFWPRQSALASHNWSKP
jgi:hypothetical protein